MKGPVTEENLMSKGHIKFNNYSVKYRLDTPIVLKNLDFEISAGQKVGIVGRTGAGKSTICLALCRIIEKLEGSIEIDGVDISTIGLADLRKRITIIPQEPVLFSNTLRFNLDPEGKCTDEQISSILERANLKDLLTRDGNGLDFKISENGSNLSTGEKALVCICRAALRKSKVVLMDEATANIDVNTEEIIQKLILEEFKDSTVLTVAHRLNTIMHSDKILVLSF
jgi:ABC-type multidrug transport system fused ATPase/permease subunit